MCGRIREKGERENAGGRKQYKREMRERENSRVEEERREKKEGKRKMKR